MHIHQLQIAHDSIQDRLLLRVSTQANEEFRVWLTRRFVHLLWPHLVGALSLTPEPLLTPTAAHANAADAAVKPPETPSFDQPFREGNPNFPLGSTPLMANEANFDKLADGGLRLTLREARERSLQVQLTADLLTAFCSMLRAASEQAEWKLALDYAKAPEAGNTAAEPAMPVAVADKPRLLH